jgi:hypothetical protein
MHDAELLANNAGPRKLKLADHFIDIAMHVHPANASS